MLETLVAPTTDSVAPRLPACVCVCVAMYARRDKARQRKARWWFDFMFDRLFNANNVPSTNDAFEVKCARCIPSFWLLDIVSCGCFICFRFSRSFFHHLLIVFVAHFTSVLCCVRCNLFNLIHNLFVLLWCYVSLELVYIYIIWRSFAPSISSQNLHLLAQDVLQQ